MKIHGPKMTRVRNLARELRLYQQVGFAERRSMTLKVWSFAISAVFLPLLAATGAPPQLQSSFPLAVARGETAEILVFGSDIETAAGVLFDCGDLDAKILSVGKTNKKPADQQIRLQVTVSQAAKVGAHAVRLFSRSGVSNAAVLLVTMGAKISSEADGGSSPDKPQPISFPALVNGRITAKGEVDYYAIELAANQSLQLEVTTASGFFRNGPSPFRTGPWSFADAQLAVYESGGSWLDHGKLRRVEVTNESFLFYFPLSDITTHRRPRYSHRFERAGRYLLAVRSDNGPSGPDYTYVLRVLPVDSSTPASMARWFPTTPVCVDGGVWEEREFRRELRTDRMKALASRNGSAGKERSEEPDIPVVAEQEPNQRHGEALKLPVPALVEGVIGTPGDTDMFRIPVNGGDKLAFEVQTPETAPPYFSPWMTIYDSEGKRLYDNIYRKIGGDGDDWVKSVEPKMIVTFAKGGDYYVEVRDLTRRVASPLFRYRLLVRSQIPHVGEVSAKTFNQDADEAPEDRFNLAPGESRKLTVLSGLEEGFAGELVLTLRDLPPGVEVFAAAATVREIPSFAGEYRESWGTAGKERFRPVRLATTLMVIVGADAPPMAEPRQVSLVARPTAGGTLGPPITGPKFLFMIVEEQPKTSTNEEGR